MADNSKNDSVDDIDALTEEIFSESDESADAKEIPDPPQDEAADNIGDKAAVKQPAIACVLPWRGDSAAAAVRKALLLVLVIASLIFMAVTIVNYNSFYEEQARIAAAIKAEAERDRNIYVGEVEIEEPVIPETAKKKANTKILDEYKELYETNKDMVGYLKIDGTWINYPVAQVKGFSEKDALKTINQKNNIYLHKNFYTGEYLFEGTIFADYRATLKPGERGANILLYGHNMANGSMFADLVHYDPVYYGDYGENFYKEHPIIQFDTIYEKGQYKVFAAMQTNVMKEDGDPVFTYNFTYKFDSEAEFVDYYGKVLDRSMFYNPDVDLQYGDEIIALSTCDFSTFPSKEIRFVVFARRVREGESAEVDVSKYYVNPDPYYYDYYYQVTGRTWGGRKWPASLLKNSELYKPETSTDKKPSSSKS